MVHGRDKDGRTDEFGVSGYVYRDVFLMFDRRTESLWYPLTHDEWTAIAGPRKGETIPFAAQPTPMPLSKWRERHPETLVLLGSRAALEPPTTRPAGNEPRSQN